MLYNHLSLMKLSLLMITLIYSILSVFFSLKFGLIPLFDSLIVNYSIGFLRYIWIFVLLLTAWYSYFYIKAFNDLKTIIPLTILNKIGDTDQLMLKVAVLFSSSALVMDTFYRLYRNNNNEHFIKGMLWEIILLTFIITLYALRKTISRYDLYIIAYMLFIIVWSAWTQERSFAGHFIKHYGFIALSIGLIAGRGRFPAIIAKSVFIIVGGTFSCYYLIYGSDIVASGNLLGYNRNSVSMITVTLALFVYLNDYIMGIKRPVFWPSVLSLYIAALSLGRGGAVIALLLLVLVTFYNLIFFVSVINENNKLSLKMKKIAVASGLILVLCSLIILADWVISYSRFTTEGIMNHTTISRIIIWKSFINELTVKKALLGFHFVCPVTGRDPHLGFFHLWSQVGIFAFPVFGFLGYLLYKYLRISFFVAGLFLLYLMFYIVGHRMLHFGMFEIIILTLSFYYFCRISEISRT